MGCINAETLCSVVTSASLPDSVPVLLWCGSVCFSPSWACLTLCDVLCTVASGNLSMNLFNCKHLLMLSIVLSYSLAHFKLTRRWYATSSVPRLYV